MPLNRFNPSCLYDKDVNSAMFKRAVQRDHSPQRRSNYHSQEKKQDFSVQFFKDQFSKHTGVRLRSPPRNPQPRQGSSLEIRSDPFDTILREKKHYSPYNKSKNHPRYYLSPQRNPEENHRQHSDHDKQRYIHPAERELSDMPSKSKPFPDISTNKTLLDKSKSLITVFDPVSAAHVKQVTPPPSIQTKPLGTNQYEVYQELSNAHPGQKYGREEVFGKVENSYLSGYSQTVNKPAEIGQSDYYEPDNMEGQSFTWVGEYLDDEEPGHPNTSAKNSRLPNKMQLAAKQFGQEENSKAANSEPYVMESSKGTQYLQRRLPDKMIKEAESKKKFEKSTHRYPTQEVRVWNKQDRHSPQTNFSDGRSWNEYSQRDARLKNQRPPERSDYSHRDEETRQERIQPSHREFSEYLPQNDRGFSRQDELRRPVSQDKASQLGQDMSNINRKMESGQLERNKRSSSHQSSSYLPGDARKDIEMQKMGKKLKTIPSHESYSSSHDKALTRELSHKASVYPTCNQARLQENIYEKSKSFRMKDRPSDYPRNPKNYSEYDMARNSPEGNSSRRKLSEFQSGETGSGKKPRPTIAESYSTRKRTTLENSYKVKTKQKSPAENTSFGKDLSLSKSSSTVMRKRPFQGTRISPPALDDKLSSGRKYQKITHAEAKKDNNKSPIVPQPVHEHIDGFELSEEEEEVSPSNALQSDDLVHINRLYNIFKKQKVLEKKSVAKADSIERFTGESSFDERKEVSDERETYLHKQAHYSAMEMDYQMGPRLSKHNEMSYSYEARPHYSDNREFSERFDHFDNRKFSDNQQYLHETYNHRALEQLDKREVQYLPKEEQIREDSTAGFVSKPTTPGLSRHVVSKDAQVDERTEEQNWKSKRNIISASSSISKHLHHNEENLEGMESPLDKENNIEFWGFSYIAWFSQNILDTKQFETYVKNSCPPSVTNNLSELPLRFIFSLANGNKHAIRCIPKNGIEVKQLLHYVDLFKKLENGVHTLCDELGMDPLSDFAGGVDKSKTPEPAQDQQSLRKVVDYDLNIKTKSSPSKKIQAPLAQGKYTPKLPGKEFGLSVSTSSQNAKPIQVLLSAPKAETQIITTNKVSSSIQNWTKQIVNIVKTAQNEERTIKKPPKEEARNISVQMGLNRSIRYDDSLPSTNDKHKLLITTAAGPENDSYQRGSVRSQARPLKEQVHGDMQHIMQETIQDMSQPKRPLKREFIVNSEERKAQHDDKIYLHRSARSKPVETANENLRFQKQKIQDHKRTMPPTSYTREKVSPHHERNYAGREPARLQEKRVSHPDVGKRKSLERKSSRNLDINSKRHSPERLPRRTIERRSSDSHKADVGSSDRQPPKLELTTPAKPSTHFIDRKEREQRSFNRRLSKEGLTVKKSLSKSDNNFNSAESKTTTEKKQRAILHKSSPPPSQPDKARRLHTIEKKEAYSVSPSALFGTTPKSTVGHLLRKVISQHKRPMFSKFQREHLGEYKRHIKRQAVRLLNFKYNLEDYDGGKINKFLHGVSNFKPRGFTGPYLYSKESTLYLLQEVFHNAEKEKIVSESLKRQLKTRGPKWNEISVKNFKALKESLDRDCHKIFGGGTTVRIDTDPRVTGFITKFEIIFPQFCGDIIEMVDMFVWSNLAAEILEGTTRFRSQSREKAKEHEETIEKLHKWLSTTYDCPPYKTSKSRNTVILSDKKWGSRLSIEIVEIVTTWWTEGYFNVRYGEASKRRKFSTSASRTTASRSDNSSNSGRKEAATKKETRPVKDEEDCNLDNMEIVDIEFGDVDTFQGAEIKEQALETGEADLTKETEDEASATSTKPEISPIELP